MTTGSTVQGLVSGMRNHFGGAEIMYVLGNPSGIVCPAAEGVGAGQGVSGGVIAYDNANNVYYVNNSGTDWLKLGSTSF